MGVKGFLAVLDSNLPSICGPIASIQGRQLVIDGVNLLHSLYQEHHLDWANGGYYVKLREITLEFFGNLQSARVQPIVVMDGAGIESHVQDVVYRRNRTIGDIPENIQKAHTSPNKEETRHFLPILSRATFVNAVKEVSGVTLICADGKANTTVVQLANHYGCPVLANDTNYCIFDVRGGVIFYKYLTLGHGVCTAYVFDRSRFFQAHLKLNDLSLVFAMVAILGDGADKSVPGLYYIRSPLQRMIDNQPEVQGGRNWPLNVAQFLHRFGTMERFKREISTFRLDTNIKTQLSENCTRAVRFYTVSFTKSCEALQDTTSIKCSYPCDVPSPLLQQFRNGVLPDFMMDAIALGQTCLCQQPGDVKQTPVVTIGCPIRVAAYGFAGGLMDQRRSAGIITEYYRNTDGAQAQLAYTAHQVNPICNTRELMVTNIAQLDEDTRISLAKQTICTILGCSLEAISTFNNDAEKSWMLVVAMTHFWAEQQLRNRMLPNADLVIRAMVYSFVKCSSQVQDESSRWSHSPSPADTFGDRNWIRAYHAALEWQCLYADTVGLNAILMQPFEVPSPACLYDGPTVLHYAVRGGIEAKVQQLTRKEKQLYEKLLTTVTSA